MDEELKSYLQRMDTRFDQMDARFQQIDARFQHMEERFQQIDVRFQHVEERFQQIDARFQQTEERIIAGIREAVEASETRLLTEFWKWGRAVDQRARRLEASDATTVDRVGNLEERVFAIERRLAGAQ